MHKLSILAAAATAAMSLVSVAVLTGPAVAQRTTISVPPTNNSTPSYSPSTESCHNQLGFLRRVYDDELDQIDNPNRVGVTPICVGEDFGLMRSDGNAGALRARIAGNDAIVYALRDRNFRPEDVVGIRMTAEDAVILYVHPFHQL